MTRVSPKFLECGFSALVSSSLCANCCFLRKRRKVRVCRGPAGGSPPHPSSAWGSPGPPGPAEAHVSTWRPTWESHPAERASSFFPETFLLRPGRPGRRGRCERRATVTCGPRLTSAAQPNKETVRCLRRPDAPEYKTVGAFLGS